MHRHTSHCEHHNLSIIKTVTTTVNLPIMKMNQFLAVLCLSATPFAMADDKTIDAAIGGGIGGAIGAAIGNEVGGRNGAILGGAIGGATGTAITTKDHESNSSHHDHRYQEQVRYHDSYSKKKSSFCPPGQAKKGNC